jgi:sugar phosphate isomerase/epimerase
MLLGGQIFKPFSTPAEWLALNNELQFNAVYFPLDCTAPDDEIDAYAKAAADKGLCIAEIGVWRNVLDPDPVEAGKAIAYAKKQLALAERVGARCCVNITGSRGTPWDGPHPDNFTRETFDQIVAVTREIIDAVNPKRTFYTLETMPWMYPHTPDSYMELMQAIDRKAFAVHFDPVNVINNPVDFYRTGDIIREWFAKLGPYIKSCHGKDVTLESRFLVHLDETRPGLGNLDYSTYIECLKQYPDVPLMTEHMHKHEEVVSAIAYIRGLIL